MSVPTVLSYVASLRKVYSVHVMMVIFWMKMEYHVMVCFSIVKLHYKCHEITIREYGSTLYVGMAGKKNDHPYNSIASDKLKSLVIYTGKFNTHIPIHI